VTVDTLLAKFNTIVFGDDLLMVISYLAPTSFADRSNTIGIANAIMPLLGIPVPGSLGQAIAELGTFLDNDSFNDALASLAPTVDSAVTQRSFMNQLQTFDAIDQRLEKWYFKAGYEAGDDFNYYPSSWVTVFNQHANQQAQQAVAGYRENTSGFVLGSDIQLSYQTLVGVALGWSVTDVNNLVSTGSLTRIQSYQGLLYSQYTFYDAFYANCAVSMAHNEYAASRNATFGTFLVRPNSNYGGWQFGTEGQVGYVYMKDNFKAIPLLSVYYSHLALDGYTETGADTADQVVQAQAYDTLLAGGGIKFLADFYTNFSLLEPEVHARIYYDFINEAMATTSQFTGGGASFGTVGIKPAPTNFNLGGSITAFSKSTDLTGTLSYRFS
jgi:outer membrane autotransporter protein